MRDERSTRKMDHSPSVLLLKTHCNLASLPGLWDHLEKNTVHSRQLWEHSLSFKRLQEASLRCDIFLLPLDDDGRHESDDVNDQDQRESENMGYGAVKHGIISFQRQVLLPCGNENVLSMGKGIQTSSMFHLTLSDCSIELSSFSLTLSTSEMRYDEEVVSSKRGHGIQLAQTNRFLVLDSRMDEREIRQAQLEQIGDGMRHTMPLNKETSGAETSHSICPEPIPSDSSVHRKHDNVLDIERCLQCSFCSNASSAFVHPNLQTSGTLLDLLEVRLHEELQSIQFLTNCLAILPCLALIAMTVWMVSDQRQKRQRESFRRDVERPRGEVSGTLYAEALSTIATLDEDHSGDNVLPSGQVGDLKQNEVDSEDFKSDHASVVGSKSGTAERTEPPLSPCSLLKSKWKAKKLKKKHQEIEMSKNSLTTHALEQSPMGSAKLVSPDSTPEIKLKRSSPGMTNLCIVGQMIEPSTDRSRQRMTPESLGDKRGEKHRRPTHQSTKTFVDNYWF